MTMCPDINLFSPPSLSSKCVYVFESLPRRDIEQNDSIANSICKVLDFIRVPYKRFDVNNVQELVFAWGTMVSCMENYDVNVIHWISHGSTESVSLGDGFTITWPVFGELLKAIPTQKRHKLYLNLCSCHGAAASIIGQNRDHVLYGNIIGANREINWPEAVISYSNFYFGLFVFEKSLMQIVDVMNGSVYSDIPRQPFVAVNGLVQYLQQKYTQRKGHFLYSALMRYAEQARNEINASIH